MRSAEFKEQQAAKARFNRLEKSGKLSKKTLLELATAEGKQEWWQKNQRDPECFIKAQMTSELRNEDESITEDGMGWMTEGQIEKMMNCPVVAAELKAEAMRRPKHMKKNKFLPDSQSEKAMLYLAPLTATEKAGGEQLKKISRSSRRRSIPTAPLSWPSKSTRQAHSGMAQQGERQAKVRAQQANL